MVCTINVLLSKLLNTDQKFTPFCTRMCKMLIILTRGIILNPYYFYLVLSWIRFLLKRCLYSVHKTTKKAEFIKNVPVFTCP